jgi:excisionase family DNA binding protein
MENIPKLVLMTSAELDSLVQSSVRKALGEHTFKSPVSDSKPINIEEASEFTGIPTATLYSYTSLRKIPFQKVGRKLLFFKPQLIEWIESKNKKTRVEIENENISYTKL